jgi:hypothetical protein
MKTCTKCCKEKPETDEHFRPYKNKKGEPRRKAICRVCEAEAGRRHAKANKVWLRPQKRAYQKEYQEAHRKPRVLVEYGKSRICTKCGEEKPLTDENFRPIKDKNGEPKWWSSHCRACLSTYSTKRAKDTQQHKKKHVRAYQKKYGESHRDEIRNVIYKRKLGITFKEVKAMAENQDHKCAICKNPIDFEDRRSFNVDHCHTNGNVRGIRIFNPLIQYPFPCFGGGEGQTIKEIREND